MDELEAFLRRTKAGKALGLDRASNSLYSADVGGSLFLVFVHGFLCIMQVSAIVPGCVRGS